MTFQFGNDEIDESRHFGTETLKPWHPYVLRISTYLDFDPDFTFLAVQNKYYNDYKLQRVYDILQSTSNV